MIEVNVPWQNSTIVAETFLYCTSDVDIDSLVQSSVYDWIQEWRNKGHDIQVTEWLVPTVGPESLIQRTEGLSFIFDNEAIAVLFKLTWCGK